MRRRRGSGHYGCGTQIAAFLLLAAVGFLAAMYFDLGDWARDR